MCRLTQKGAGGHRDPRIDWLPQSDESTPRGVGAAQGKRMTRMNDPRSTIRSLAKVVLIFLWAVTAAGPAVANASETGPIPTPLGPWTFQMTPEQVMAAKDHGPYKSFSNGDLETYAGDFDGEKENIQFFFQGGRLVRMMVSRYEGPDVHEAARVFGETYAVLKSMYGAIETPDITSDRPGEDLTPELVAIASGPQAELSGKTQLAPVKQPSYAFVFSSLAKQDVQGKVYYYVRVIYDPPKP